MQTILVPTDFSDTAKNAAHYALQLAQQLGYDKIILYNVFQQPVSIDPVMGPLDPVMSATEFYDVDVFKNISENGLAKFKEHLLADTQTTIALETLSDYNILSEGVDEVCETTGATLVIMGITGVGKVEEILIGSNAISVAKHSQVPLIIVPSNAVYKPIKEVLLVCDFKNVTNTTPVDAVKKLVDATQAKLFVLNIDHHNINPATGLPFETTVLDNLLQGYNHSYHDMDNPDFTAGINSFVDANAIDITVTIPKKHGWFEGLFKTSHTNELAFHGHVPLMVIHE